MECSLKQGIVGSSSVPEESAVGHTVSSQLASLVSGALDQDGLLPHPSQTKPARPGMEEWCWGSGLVVSQAAMRHTPDMQNINNVICCELA